MRQLLFLLVAIPHLLVGQTIDQKIKEASSQFENKDFGKSLVLFRQLRVDYNKKDTAFGKISWGYAASLYYSALEAKNKEEWEKVINLSTEFVKLLDDDREYLGDYQDKKYWSYKDFVVAYNATGQPKKAEIYRKMLYDGYKNKKLPKGIEEYYNFDKFVFENYNVWGYEWYPDISSPEAEGSFSKQVYYVYTRNSAGEDGEQLYTLQTVKVHKLSNDEPDYVLTKRTYSNDAETSETIWHFVFNDPIDQAKLHDAIVEYMRDKIPADTESVIKR